MLRTSLIASLLACFFGLSTAAQTAPPPTKKLKVELPGGATLEMVWIEPGTFVMGSPVSEAGRDSDEGPQHQVRLSQGFYLGKYELTQEQWTSVMGSQPWADHSYVQNHARHPAVSISWDDVQLLLGHLNEGAGEKLYRLPTEAEREYACRAGTTTRWSFDDTAQQLDDYAWYRANAWDAGQRYAHAVGSKLPNRWGLYDMHGNVWEWVQDWYNADYYNQSPAADPPGAATGSRRSMRGGGFVDYARGLSSARRAGGDPDGRSVFLGVRLLRIR